jgi:hypothetical protein
MKFVRQASKLCVSLVLVIGCASTNVTQRDIGVTESLPRPDQIWVYDFTATPSDVPAESALSGQYGAQQTATAAQLAEARTLGAEIARELVADIQGMGLPAMRATSQPALQLNDLVIRGYFVSIDEGSATKRILIGFGSGAAELKTAVEGFQVTERGLRKLGSGTVDSSGGKGPGAAVPAAIAIATANPIGLIVSSAVKVYGEESGSSTIEGRAKGTAAEIAAQIKPRFQQQGWIQ